MDRPQTAPSSSIAFEDVFHGLMPPSSYPLTPPSKMAMPSVKPINSYAVSVSWVPPADFAAQRGVNSRRARTADPDRTLVCGFQLRYQTLNLEDDILSDYTEVSNIWPPEAQQACLKWLKGGLTYLFEVRAFNDAGEGDWSDSGEPFLMPKAASRSGQCTSRDLEEFEEIRPQGLSSESDSIEITWKRPCDRGAPIVTYDLLCCKDQKFRNAPVKELRINGDDCRALVRGLEPNTTYFFKYRANNEIGSSPWSASTPGIATKSKPPEEPYPPYQLESGENARRATEVSIRWHPPVSFGIPIQHYSVRASKYPDMKDAVDILVGDRGGGAICGQEIVDGTVASESAPSSPARGRPGFNKGQYALTQLRVKGLNPMTEYYFQVKAQNQIGESEWSQPSKPMLTAASPPARCGQAKFIEGSHRIGFRIRWSRPDSHGLPITQFDVRFSRMVMMSAEVQLFENVETKVCKALDAGPDDVEATLFGTFSAGTEFFCQTKAWNRAGSGNWSTVSEAMKVAPERPSMPEAPARFTSLPRAVVVHWEPSICLGAPVIRYRLRYDTTREMRSPVEVQGLKGTTTEFAVTGLAPHHSYHFQLACVNSVGCSEWSAASRPVQVMQMPPVKMSSPFLVEPGQTRTAITVGFTPPVDCGTHDGQLIQSYTLRYSESRQRLEDAYGEYDDSCPEFKMHLIRDAQPEGVTCANLRPGKPHFFQIFAVNEFGEGEPSEVTEFGTYSASPLAPFPPTMVEYTDRTLVLALNPDEDRGSSITHYTLQVFNTDKKTSWIIEPFEAHMLECEDRQHYCINDLKPGTTYRVQCGALNRIGKSPWSPMSQAFRTKPTAPGKISRSEIQVSNVTQTTFKILWTPPVDNGSEITEYTVSRCTTGKFEIKSSLHKEERTTATELLVSDLAPGSLVFVKVTAHNAQGQGEAHKPIEVPMKIGPPYAVIKPLYRDVTSHSVRLLWGVPYDGGDQIKRFWVSWEETNTDGHIEAERDFGEMMVNGLKRQTNVVRLHALREYVFKIAAENSVGVGPYGEGTEPVRLKPPQKPGPPGQPAFISATTTMLTVHWGSAEPNGASLLQQVVRISKHPSMPEDDSFEVLVQPYGLRPYNPKGKSPNKNRVLKNPGQTTLANLAEAASGNSISVTASPYEPVGKVDLDLATVGEMDLASTTDTDTSMNKWSPQKSARDDTALPQKTGPLGITPTWHHTPGRRASAISTAVTASNFGQKDKGFMQIFCAARGKTTAFGDNEYEIPHLKGGQDYYLAVAARNSVGQGVFGPVSEMMSTRKGPPLDIETLEFTTPCSSSLTLQWGIPDYQGSPILHYQILCAAVDVQQSGIELDSRVHEYQLRPQEIDDPEQPTFIIQNLLPGVCYSAMVCTTNDYGTSEWVTVEDAQRTLAMVPAKMEPPEPIIAERTQASVTFEWILPACRGSPVTAIELRHMAASIEEATQDSLDVAELGTSVVFERDPDTGGLPTKHTICGFLPGTMVAIIARGINAEGPGDWSERPGMIGREKRQLLNRGESAHAIVEGDERVMERTLLRQRPKSAPYGSVKHEDNDNNDNRVRALDLFLKYTTMPTMPTAPEAPHFIPEMLTPFSGVFTFKVGKMNGLVYTEFGFRVFGGVPGEDLEMIYSTLGEDGQEPTREFQTPVSYDENSAILSREYMRQRWVLDLKPGTVYAVQAYTANELGNSDWSPIGPPVRTPPDRPVMTRAILSEFTSPSHIQLRWGPPYHNGSPIKGYDIRYNDRAEYLPLAQWTKIPQESLENDWKEHDYDYTARTYEVRNLGGGIPHFFIFRAWNDVGFSDWSEVSRFVTKPSRPAKISLPVCTEARPTELVIQWGEPNYHGAPITRYECLASMKKTIVTWCRVAGEKLFNTNDLDRIFGTDRFQEELADEDGRYEVGHKSMGKLDCDEAFYTFLPPTPEICHCEMSGLIPGKSYHFMVRGISDAGKGNWSNIAGPLRTASLYPAKPVSMQVESTSITTAAFSFALPYDNGAPIQSARLVVRRFDGPVADHERHPETGEVHEHVGRGEKDFDPLALNTVEVEGLLPGSDFEVIWACINSCGLGLWSDPAVFKTLPGIPDVPGEIELPGF